MPDVPESIAELIGRYDEIVEDLIFVRQLMKLTIHTNRGDVVIERSPESENAVLNIADVLALSIDEDGFANPMTDQWDMIVGGSGGAPARLAYPVTAGYQLTFTNGEIRWAAPGVGLTNPMSAAGDLIVGTTGGVPDRLGIAATDGWVLTVTAGVVAWAPGGLSNPMTTQGDIIVATAGGTPDRLPAPATAGYQLTFTAGAVQWAPPAAASGGSGPTYFTKVYCATAVTLASGVGKYITWDGADSNSYGLWDGSSDHLTIPTGAGGVWSLQALGSFYPATINTCFGNRYVVIEANGNYVGQMSVEVPSAASGQEFTQLQPHATCVLTAGDQIKLYMQHDFPGGQLKAGYNPFTDQLWLSAIRLQDAP